MKINLSRCALVIWSSLKLTSKQWNIIQQFTARADLIFKRKKIKIFQYTSIVFLSIYQYTRYGYSSMCTDSPKTSLFAYTEYGCRGRLRLNFRFLAHWIRQHGWLIETFWHIRKVTKSRALAYITVPILSRAAIQLGLGFVLAFIYLRTVCCVCEEQVLFWWGSVHAQACLSSCCSPMRCYNKNLMCWYIWAYAFKISMLAYQKKFGLRIHQIPYLVSVSSEGSGESVLCADSPEHSLLTDAKAPIYRAHAQIWWLSVVLIMPF